MIIRDITANDRQEFNLKAGHPLQSFEWGEFRKLSGIKVVRKGLFKEGKLEYGLQVTIHPIPRSSYQVGYFPKGPMPDENQLKVLTQIGRENNCILVKIEPNVGSVVKDDQTKIRAWKNIDEFLRRGNCKSGRALFTRYSFQLDLKETQEKLLAKMHPKTRYNIRLAERKGVKVAVDNSKTAFEWFLKLLFEETVVRQGFYAHSPEYFKKMWQVLKPAGKAYLLRAYVGQETLAVFMVFLHNQKIYYPYGASTRARKELMAPNLLMWEVIKFGQKNNCQSLDMWGAMGPKPNKKDPWYGFHRFKAGYGGDLIEFLGTYDLVIQPQLYPVYRIADNWRWKSLRVKSKIKQLPRKMKRWKKKIKNKAEATINKAAGLFE